MKLLGKVATAHRRINSLRYPLQDRTESRGLSGEHIQLCAEGARRPPNLSGKRTEMQSITDLLAVFMQSSFLWDCNLFYVFL